MTRSPQRGAGETHANAAFFVEPRAIYILAVVSLVCFGLLMVYSASSIHAMLESGTNNDATYYFIKQLKSALIGIVVAAFMARFDYHIWSRDLMAPLGIATLAILLLIRIPGVGATINGARRWIQIGTHTVQPSEFAKLSIIIIAAKLGEELQELGPDDGWYKRLFLFVAAPLALILFEPDKGTVVILGLTLLIMLWYCGIETTLIAGIMIIAASFGLALVLTDEYALKRIKIMLNPGADPADAGYQINQGFLAFGTGGLFGVGLGMSHQKYDFLPEVHTDYIYAIIGEELGLVGTLLVLLLFGALVYSGYEIARRASDVSGRLIASGFSTLMAVQLFVNVCGVLGLIPASGKPIPFISYGGSSIIACLMMSGLVISVSTHSTLPVTVYEERRSRLRLYEGPDTGGDAGLRVLSGGSFGGPSPSELRSTYDMVEAHGGTITYNANGTRRINLGGNASDRLRGRGGSGATRR